MIRKDEAMMSLKTLGIVSAVTACLAVPQLAGAAGFQVNEHGSAAMGQANAVTATVDDPSAIYHNPAGLASVEGTQAQVGVTLISPHGSYTGKGFTGTESKEWSASSQFIPVPHAYVTRALSSKAFLGIGVYAPYGLKVQWDDPAFTGRTEIEVIELQSIFISPTVALKLNDMLQVGAGVNLVPASVHLKQALGAEDNGQVLFPASQYGTEGTVELAGSAFGVGANLGAQLTLMQKLKIGLVYRSAVDLSFTGNADFQLGKGVPAEIAAKFPDGPVTTAVTLPHSFNLGIGWKDGPLTLEVGTQITMFKFDELRINFSRNLPTPSSVSARNWTTTPLFKAGGSYALGDLKLRAGLGYDISPVPTNTIDPTLPDADRFFFTLGVGYAFGPVVVDAGYMGLVTGTREVKAGESVTFTEGTYTGGMSHLVALSFGVKL